MKDDNWHELYELRCADSVVWGVRRGHIWVSSREIVQHRQSQIHHRPTTLTSSENINLIQKSTGYRNSCLIDFKLIVECLKWESSWRVKSGRQVTRISSPRSRWQTTAIIIKGEDISSSDSRPHKRSLTHIHWVAMIKMRELHLTPVISSPPVSPLLNTRK